MRHRKSKYALNRFTSWHDATVISIAKNVLIRERIVTTKIKALAARPLLEKLIGLGKKNTLHARRQAYKVLGEHSLVSLLFSDIAQRFNDRVGGYVRILGFGRRRGDNAELVLLELTQIKKKEKRPKKIKEEREAGKEDKQLPKEKPAQEKKARQETAVADKEREKERPPATKKPDKKFLGGLRNIFKKKSDSL